LNAVAIRMESRAAQMAVFDEHRIGIRFDGSAA
jgi:hypothetical protein